ncbi:esterase-like activity of phytase family protein [Parvularcula flava]|uniref:Esterase-like activity of phytase family protein n=1 Tax=Aquisalinus luteolus TaxID=1566827 RepID=A0A8J3A648_9PROT|nr:esterase-like activity of phytase family protein [Aquisalinus luteolus]NHK27064.1 esterase-like activity of phytase family protein [Aquisalinus luteolus]GGH94256.1 hypothetical protein GCM10011355_08010 [Aquisalinus luteolus]
MRLSFLGLRLTAAALAIGIAAPAMASAWIGHSADAPKSVAAQREIGAAWQEIEITARPFGENSATGEPAPLTMGKLRLAGALVLTSPDEAFGGFSGLRFAADEGRLYAISDRAKWLRADVDFAENGAVESLSGGVLANFTFYGGEIITGARADAESLALTPDGGAIVGFEREHRIEYYTREGDEFVIAARLMPKDLLEKLPGNESLESVVMLADGRTVTIAEGTGDGRAERPGWIAPPDILAEGTGDWSPFQYVPAEEFSPTDMAQDPETGDIYVVERAFSRTLGVRARLTRFPLSALQPGALIEPEELAYLNALHGVDNMEGLDLRRREDGQLMLYILSDDNFNIAQRTVLMSWIVTDRPL